MPIIVHTINLDRSKARWQAFSESAAAAGVDIARVPAVDGKAIAEGDRRDTDEKLFLRRNGRGMQPGEYGCYQSHLAALRAFLDGGERHGVIAEDDIQFPKDFRLRLDSVASALPEKSVVKLVNHRVRGFRPSFTAGVDRIGRCLHGPNGSAACYLVDRPAAEALLARLRPMTLPYDIALERGWETGVATYTTERPLVHFGALVQQTEIATKADYRSRRLPEWQRLPTHLFRAADYARRVSYGLRGE